MSDQTATGARTDAAIAARRRRSQAAVQRVHDALTDLRRDNTKLTVALVARRALFTEQGREFLQLSSQVAG